MYIELFVLASDIRLIKSTKRKHASAHPTLGGDGRSPHEWT